MKSVDFVEGEKYGSKFSQIERAALVEYHSTVQSRMYGRRNQQMQMDGKKQPPTFLSEIDVVFLVQ